jgi:DNA-directed RNA polymerase I, II, and III subunit RPABC3
MEELFGDEFRITDKDPDGVQFSNITRVEGMSDSTSADLILEVNSQLLPIDAGDSVIVVLSRSDAPSWDPSLFERFQGAGWDYVMHGKVYGYDDRDERGRRVTIRVSCGGLLLAVTGDAPRLAGIQVGRDVFVQIRKV